MTNSKSKTRSIALGENSSSESVASPTFEATHAKRLVRLRFGRFAIHFVR